MGGLSDRGAPSAVRTGRPDLEGAAVNWRTLCIASLFSVAACGGTVRDEPTTLPQAFCRALVIDACAFPPGTTDLTGSWTGSAALELNIPATSEEACLERAHVLDDYMPPELIPAVVAAFEADPCNPDLRALDSPAKSR